ncbi:MAG: hypothetical protein ACK4YP_17760 [Myxococcota bacterium]
MPPIDDDVLLATILLSGPGEPTLADLHVALANAGFGSVRLASTPEGTDVALPGGAVLALDATGGVPREAADLAASLLNWPENDDVIARVRGSLSVAGGGLPGDTLDRHLAFTRLVAAVCIATPNALAVTWHPSPNLVYAGEIVAQAKRAERDDPPTPAWIALTAARAPEGAPNTGAPAMLTRGLATFGHPELLLPVTPEEGADLAGLAWGVAAEVVAGRLTLEPGVAVQGPAGPLVATRAAHPTDPDAAVVVLVRARE